MRGSGMGRCCASPGGAAAADLLCPQPPGALQHQLPTGAAAGLGILGPGVAAHAGTASAGGGAPQPPASSSLLLWEDLAPTKPPGGAQPEAARPPAGFQSPPLAAALDAGVKREPGGPGGGVYCLPFATDVAVSHAAVAAPIPSTPPAASAAAAAAAAAGGQHAADTQGCFAGAFTAFRPRQQEGTSSGGSGSGGSGGGAVGRAARGGACPGAAGAADVSGGGGAGQQQHLASNGSNGELAGLLAAKASAAARVAAEQDAAHADVARGHAAVATTWNAYADLYGGIHGQQAQQQGRAHGFSSHSAQSGHSSGGAPFGGGSGGHASQQAPAAQACWGGGGGAAAQPLGSQAALGPAVAPRPGAAALQTAAAAAAAAPQAAGGGWAPLLPGPGGAALGGRGPLDVMAGGLKAHVGGRGDLLDTLSEMLLVRPPPPHPPTPPHAHRLRAACCLTRT
jgi:hypothetical protein